MEEQKALWQRELRWDYSPSADLIKRYVDSCALPGYAAVDRGRAVGYGFYVYENYKGLIGDVFVSESYRDRNMEAQLLMHVIETLQATPGIRRIEGQLMNLRQELPCDFSLEQNLRNFRRKFMMLQLKDSQSQSQNGGTRADGAASSGTGSTNRELKGNGIRPVPHPEIKLVAWDARWLSEAAHLIARAYRGHIDSAISDQYRSRAGAMHFLDNIINYPGCGTFDAHCSFLAIRKDSSELCGLGLTSVVGDRVSHITQVCVEPQWQGTGIGRTLVCHIIDKLRERGTTAISLTVTSSNRHAIHLYEQLHFATLREFPAFAWDAPGTETEFNTFA